MSSLQGEGRQKEEEGGREMAPTRRLKAHTGAEDDV